MIAEPAGAYAAWVSWLEAFARGDVDEPVGLEAMEGAKLGAPAAARLTRHVEAAVQARLQLWSEAFSHDLKRLSNPDDFRRAAIAARRRFALIRALVANPPLLPEIVESLAPGLDEILAQAQKALDDQARRLPGGGHDLVSAIRDTPLTGRSSAVMDGSVVNEAPPVRRPILLPNGKSPYA